MRSMKLKNVAWAARSSQEQPGCPGIAGIARICTASTPHRLWSWTETRWQ